MPSLAGAQPRCLCSLSVGSAGHPVKIPQCLGLWSCHGWGRRLSVRLGAAVLTPGLQGTLLICLLEKASTV